MLSGFSKASQKLYRIPHLDPFQIPSTTNLSDDELYVLDSTKQEGGGTHRLCWRGIHGTFLHPVRESQQSSHVQEKQH